MQQERTEKPCRICGQTKPLASFAPNRKMLDGRLHQCRACLAEKTKARRARDPDRYLGRRRARYAANRDVENARTNAWKQAHPEHIVKSRLSTRRADGRYAVGQTYSDISCEAAEYGVLLLKDPCSYCGGPAGDLDHIIAVAEGGTNDWDNLTATCRSCNSRKRDRPMLDALIRGRIMSELENWSTR
jgi:5-methylcytosine-specific restriction endonuclease McrA